MTVPIKSPPQGDIMESVIIKGDLAKLTPDERVKYYNEVCRSIGLNPLTQPFSFIVLNGKLQLYALRACADQLRKINGVSLEIVSRELAAGILTFHVRAKLPDGRTDEDLGAVAFPDTLKGEARANAELKAVTKAKRRATLSICGLGWLDETEIADIPASAKKPPPPAPNVMIEPPAEPPHDGETGEIENNPPQVQHPPAADPPGVPPGKPGAGVASSVVPTADGLPSPGAGQSADARFAELDGLLAAAAEKGMTALANEWAGFEPADRKLLKAALDRRHKLRAQQVDRERATA